MQQLRMIRMVGLRQRMHVQRAEALGEPDVLLEAHSLVAKEDHLVRDQCAANRIELGLRQLLRKINAEDLGTECRRQRLDVELMR